MIIAESVGGVRLGALRSLRPLSRENSGAGYKSPIPPFTSKAICLNTYKGAKELDYYNLSAATPRWLFS